MHKVLTSSGQVLDPKDMNRFGYFAHGGMAEIMKYLLGGVGTVLSGWDLHSSYFPRRVRFNPGRGVASLLSGRGGSLIISPQSKTVTCSENTTGSNRYDLIQVNYRDLPGEDEPREVLDPVHDTVSSPQADTEFQPEPVWSKISSLTPNISATNGYLPIAEITVEPGVTTIPVGLIQDRRVMAMDGLRMSEVSRTATINMSGSGLPDATGGGKVWIFLSGKEPNASFSSGGGLTILDNPLTLDKGVNWLDRYIYWSSIFAMQSTWWSMLMPGGHDMGKCMVYNKSSPTSYVTKYLATEFSAVPEFDCQICKGMWFTGGGITDFSHPGIHSYNSPNWEEWLRFSISSQGELQAYYSCQMWAIMQISYSPRQKHYRSLYL